MRSINGWGSLFGEALGENYGWGFVSNAFLATKKRTLGLNLSSIALKRLKSSWIRSWSHVTHSTIFLPLPLLGPDFSSTRFLFPLKVWLMDSLSCSKEAKIVVRSFYHCAHLRRFALVLAFLKMFAKCLIVSKIKRRSCPHKATCSSIHFKTLTCWVFVLTLYNHGFHCSLPPFQHQHWLPWEAL